MSSRAEVLRHAARAVGFPPGMGILLSRGTRVKLLASLAGSVLLAVLDMLGVLAMLPMMQLVAGVDHDEGALGLVVRTLGRPSDRALVLTLAVTIVGAFTLKDLIAIGFRVWQLRFLADQEVETSSRILRGFLTGPYARHLTTNTGDKVWTVEGAVTIGVTTGISSALGALTQVVTIVLVFGSLLVVQPLASVLALVYFGAAGLVLQRGLRRRISEAGTRNVAASQATASISLQSFGAVKEIKLRRAEQPFLERYAAGRRAGSRARATAVFLDELPKYLLEIVFVVGIALLAFAVATATSAEQGLVTLGLFVAAGSRILPSTVRLIASVSGVRFSRPSLEHLVHECELQRAAEQAEHDQVRTERVPEGDLVVRDLTFAYADRPDELVLRGVDAHVPAGRSVAVVGSSGAGKSTLVDLLIGLHRPSSGSVTAGGVDVFANLPAWQRRLAVVPQEVYLLDATLRDNITFDEHPDPDRIAAAVARAQLGDLVAGLPDGLDTEVGEQGVRLSGGQRQRIGIARALYREPSLLVLDEATSALDNETERRLTDTIESLKGSMTMVIVAHRLSTVRHCDSLIFMNAGRVVATGTFDEVAATSSEFARLVELGTLAVSR